MDVETGVFHSKVPKLHDLFREMHGHPKTIHTDFNCICNSLAMVAAILEYQSNRRLWGDQQEQQFNHEVRKLSLEIEIFMDKLRLIPTLEGFKGLMEKMGAFVKKGKTPHQILAREIKRFKAELEILCKLHESFGFGSLDSPAALQDRYPEVKGLVAIDGKKDQELIMLLSDGDNTSNKKLKIVSVVGHGGLGKTTLVKAVHAKIGGGLDSKAFVPVGQNADAKKVFRDIISQLTKGSNTCTLNEQELIEKLREILENKRVCKLEQDDLKILREISRLHTLIVRLEVLPKEMIRISREGFAKLERFYVDCRMPRVIFEEGAMPNVEHLQLKLYGGTASEEQMGMKHLLNLQKVTLWYFKWYATNKCVRETTDAMKTEAKEHQSKITLCITEEDKDGGCSMKTEIFQENKDASCSRMTEIKQEGGHADRTGDYHLNGDGTREGALHQSIYHGASCSGTKEIEEVAE